MSDIKMDPTVSGGMLPSWLNNILTSKLFMFNCLFSFAWLMYAKKSIKPLIQKTEEHKARDIKFAAFKRLDLDRLSKSWACYFWLPTTFIRLFIPYASIAVMCLFTWIFSFFKSEDVNFDGFSFQIIRCF